MELIDLSQVIENGMPVYPGDDNAELVQSHSYIRDGYNNHRLKTGMHVGTHIDGPMHMTDVREYIANLPLENFCGKGCIINAENESVITQKTEYEDRIRGNEIVLIHTGMSAYYGQDKYYSEHPVIDMSFGELLVKNKIKMVGIDAPSPDRPPYSLHKFLLRNNIFILENLTNLEKIESGLQFEVMAFPLKIMADSGLVRALAKVYGKKADHEKGR